MRDQGLDVNPGRSRFLLADSYDGSVFPQLRAWRWLASVVVVVAGHMAIETTRLQPDDP